MGRSFKLASRSKVARILHRLATLSPLTLQRVLPDCVRLFWPRRCTARLPGQRLAEPGRWYYAEAIEQAEVVRVDTDGAPLTSVGKRR
jgi:hypothetical protein